jgi:hypothetical protein
MPNSNEQSYYCGSATLQSNVTIAGNIKFIDPLGYSDLQQKLTQVAGYAQLLGVSVPQPPSGLNFCEQYAWASKTAQALSDVYEGENNSPL